MSLPVVAIVGRPNVGKSTLFNRLIGFRKSVVHDRPGVTRDRIYEQTSLLGRHVLLVDTGGYEPEPETGLLQAMRSQTLAAIEQADVLLFLVDAQAGWTPADAEVAALLRRTDKPVRLVVNKVDGPRHEDLAADFYGVGMPLLTLSAEHGRGVYELYEAVLDALGLEPGDDDEPDLPDDLTAEAFDADDADADAAHDDPSVDEIRIAVVGRPNIGKSTLVNRLLGEDRHLVFDQPGTTMDAVDSPVVVGDQRYVLVDTAGVRKKSKIDDRLERFVSLRAIKAIERCHVTILLIDALEGPTDQDSRLAQLAIDRGRGVILLINKWDLTRDNPDISAKGIEEQIRMDLPHLPWAPVLFISAKTGKGCGRILPLVDQVFTEFNKRISTSRLNRFLEVATSAHSVPQKHHHPVKLYYMAQTRVRPPSFVVFSNTPDGVTAAYQRYLQNQLREAFGFEGSPIRLYVRRRRKLGEPRSAG